MTTPAQDPLVGRTVGQYHILTRIGGGGMGVVYTARASRLGRVVALKFLPPQWSHDDSAKQRFVREAQAASATNHPNICTIHDIETADDGQLFIVMAYYEGETLKKRLESGPLPIEEALDIATQISDGLAKAHAQGVVHRDIKPGNIILTEEGVRILDFGLATFVDALKLTIENAPLGTVAYMAPEQVRGLQADARTDVWATGAVLYEMLIGHPPFRGSHAEAIGYAVRNEAATPIRAERAEVSEEVEQFVFRALHKEPGVRYQSGRDLARALRRVRGLSVPLELNTQPVERPVETAQRRRRLPWMWRVAAAAAILLAVGATWSAWPIDRTTVVVAPFGNQTGDADLEQYRPALTQALTMSLSESRALQVVNYHRVLEVLRRFIRDRADISNREVIQSISSQTGVSLVIVPTLVRDGVAWRAHVELRDSQTASRVWQYETASLTSSLTHDTAYRLSAALATAIDDHMKPRRARFLDVLERVWPGAPTGTEARTTSLEAAKAFADGTSWYEDLEYASARESFQDATERDPQNPLLLAWLSRAAQLTRDDKGAVDAAAQSVAAITFRTTHVEALFAQAVASEARRDTEGAERAYRALIAARPNDPTWTMELAAFLERQVRWDEAVAAYHDALKADPRLIRPRLELCRLYAPSRLNEPLESKKHGQAALEAYRAIGASGGEGQSLLCLADTLALGNEADRTQARSSAEAAHKIFEDLDYRYNEARAEYYLAITTGALGRFEESIAIGERALNHARESGNTPVQPIIMSNLGYAHVALGKRVQAADYYQQAYKMYQSWRDESRAARIQANRGAMLIEYGNPEEGILDVRNALTVSEHLGDKNFQTFCLRVIATYFRNQGRHEDAIRELNRGLAIARERNLAENVTVMTTFVGLSQFEMGDYEGARKSLLDALKDGTGRRSTEARIRLARSYVRLGDLPSADAELGTAERQLQAAPDGPLQALLWLVRGERAYEARQTREALSSFERASALWGETIPEPAAVEARALAGFLDAQGGRIDAGRNKLETALDAARKLGQLSLEARCLILLADVEMRQQRVMDADRWLDAIPADQGGRTVGPELRAQAYVMRSRVQAARGELGAAQRNVTAARALIRTIAERLSEKYRVLFGDRQTVRQILG